MKGRRKGSRGLARAALKMSPGSFSRYIKARLAKRKPARKKSKGQRRSSGGKKICPCMLGKR